ncbi:hypothetical protein Dimus_036536, partial [Dionaea muscipula]
VMASGPSASDSYEDRLPSVSCERWSNDEATAASECGRCSSSPFEHHHLERVSASGFILCGRARLEQKLPPRRAMNGAAVATPRERRSLRATAKHDGGSGFVSATVRQRAAVSSSLLTQPSNFSPMPGSRRLRAAALRAAEGCEQRHADISSSQAAPPSSDAAIHEQREAASNIHLPLIRQRSRKPCRATAAAHGFSSMQASLRRGQQLGYERGPVASFCMRSCDQQLSFEPAWKL